MELHTNNIESVTFDDILHLATWSRERSSDELQDFITARHSALGEVALGIE